MTDYTKMTDAHDLRRAIGELIAAIDDVVEAWTNGDLAENVNAAEALADFYRHGPSPNVEYVDDEEPCLCGHDADQHDADGDDGDNCDFGRGLCGECQDELAERLAVQP